MGAWPLDPSTDVAVVELFSPFGAGEPSGTRVVAVSKEEREDCVSESMALVLAVCMALISSVRD